MVEQKACPGETSKDIESSCQGGFTDTGNGNSELAGVQTVVLETGIRLEGPYFTPVKPSRFKTVICLVAGTGVSGALALANAFVSGKLSCENGDGEMSRCGHGDCVGSPKSIWDRCVVVWTVRESDYIDLPAFRKNPSSDLETRIHLSSPSRPRLDMNVVLKDLVNPSDAMNTWVYISGPNNFIAAAEEACKKVAGLQYYGARWEI